jgi:hypothetical protein
MVRRLGSLLFFVWLAGSSAWGQISFPGITRTKTQAPAATIDGILRRISDDDIVVETDDKRIVTVALGITTKYYKASGAMIKAADLQPGDHMSIDATQDDHGYYHAKNVNQVKVGTAAERASASRLVDTSPVSSPASSAASSPAPQSPPPPDPNDPGPPALRRGVPQRSSASSGTITCNDTRPSIHAAEVNGVTRIPDAPRVDTNGGGTGRVIIPQGGDAVIYNARQAAFAFSETLPNFMVKQFTTRYQSEALHGGQTSWRAQDTVTAEVVSEDGKESYKNILVNGKPPTRGVENSGSWSTGEFSSVMLDVLSPGTRADFHNKRSTTIVNRAAYLFDFSVERQNSHWQVESLSGTYVPEYTGAIWIDKETSRVLRIELSAKNMPRTFALDTVESAVDYDYVQIGDGRFLLPVHSEVLSCGRATSECSRNVIDFRNYKKFSADTSVTFDDPADK